MSQEKTNETIDETLEDKTVEEASIEDPVEDEEASEQVEAAGASDETLAEEETSTTDAEDARYQSLLDQHQRLMAEFENFRKRSQKEKAEQFDVGTTSVINKLLPVVDNFERGLDMMRQDEAQAPLLEGVELIYRQLMEMLEGMGVHPISALGETFDPAYHNALMHEDNPDAGEMEIVEEFAKGYQYKDKVIRHSMVKVAN